MLKKFAAYILYSAIHSKKVYEGEKNNSMFIKTYSSKPNILTKIKIFQTDHLQKNALL